MFKLSTRRAIQAISVAVLLLSVMTGRMAFAAEHFVPSSTATINCASFAGGVKPGDTLILAAGKRGQLLIRDCLGTAERPIVVKNDPSGAGPVIISRSTAATGGFVLELRNVRHVVLDGTAKWRNAPADAYCGAPNGTNGCGIKVTKLVSNDSPSSLLHVRGMSTDVTIRGVEIDGRYAGEAKVDGPVGIQVNDHSIVRSENPGFWRENFLLERNYVHNVRGEGFYLGPNWREERIELRNIEVRHNLVHDTGRNGIQLKSGIGGGNRIWHNVVQRTGISPSDSTGGMKTGISAADSICIISHNFVADTGEAGIHFYIRAVATKNISPVPVVAYNNVIVNTGLNPITTGHGITASRNSSETSFKAEIYNNTVVNTLQAGVRASGASKGSVVRDNILVDYGTTDIQADSIVARTNNLTGASSIVKFVDASRKNFRLLTNSPARSNGSLTGFPDDDYDRISRLHGGRTSQGAFELPESGPSPKSPQMLSVD